MRKFFRCRANADAAARSRHPPHTATAIPLPEVPIRRAESAAANLRDIETNFSTDPVSKIVDQELPNLGREIDARHEESSKILTTAPSLETLRSLNRDWEKLHDTVATWNRELLRQTTQLDEQIDRLTLLQDTWEQTLQLTKGSDTPGPILDHVHAVIDSIVKTRDAAEKRRAQILELQNRVAEVDGRVSQALASVQRAREQALSRIFTRDSPADLGTRKCARHHAA